MSLADTRRAHHPKGSLNGSPAETMSAKPFGWMLVGPILNPQKPRRYVVINSVEEFERVADGEMAGVGSPPNDSEEWVEIPRPEWLIKVLEP